MTIPNESMAIGEFYSVPEIDLSAATDSVFGNCISDRHNKNKERWAGEQFVDLAGRRPEELPPCFLAVQAGALSPSTGWETEHGWWEPKERVLVEYITSTSFLSNGLCTRTTLVFRPKDGSKSDFAMNLYAEVSLGGFPGSATGLSYFLEEDIALCRVFRVTRGKGKGVVHSEASPPSFCQSQFGYAADPVHELSKLDFSVSAVDVLSGKSDKGDIAVDEFSTFDLSGLVISPIKTAFVKGRYILDGVVILHETSHEIKMKKISAVVFKVDFEKAYDKIEKSFLEQVLVMKGFPSDFVRWVMATVNDGKVAVMVNDQTGPYFRTHRGLHSRIHDFRKYTIWT